MKRKSTAVVFIAVVLAAMVLTSSCAQKQKAAVPDLNTPASGAAIQSPAPATEQRFMSAVEEKSSVVVADKTKPQTKDQKIIKTKQVQLEVTDVIQTKSKIEQMISRYGGYVSNLTTSSDGAVTPEPVVQAAKDKITRATIEVRIPVKRLDSFVKEIKKTGKLESEAEQALDITLEYTDLSARLKNQQAAEERLLEMYASAKTVEDMLKIEAQLTTVRAEIETLQGQINYYNDMIALSTVTIDIHEPSEIATPEWRKGLADALNEAISNFMSVIIGSIALSGSCLAMAIPLALVALVVYLVFRLMGRRRKISPKK